MATYNMVEGEIYITNGTVDTGAGTITYDDSSTYMVSIKAQQQDSSFTNNMINTPTFVTKNYYTTKNVQNRVVNLKRIKEILKITGYVVTDSGGDNCIEKKQKLRYLAGATDTDYGKYGSSLTLVWKNLGEYQEFTGFIEKGALKEVPSKDKVMVTIQFLVGELL